MSVSIYFGRDYSPEGEPVVICGGSPSMSELVYPTADILKEKHPEVFNKSFESLMWGEVYLYNLDKREFNIVYEITKDIYWQRYSKESFDAPGNVLEKNWREYLIAMEKDLRAVK